MGTRRNALQRNPNVFSIQFLPAFNVNKIRTTGLQIQKEEIGHILDSAAVIDTPFTIDGFQCTFKLQKDLERLQKELRRYFNLPTTGESETKQSNVIPDAQWYTYA